VRTRKRAPKNNLETKTNSAQREKDINKTTKHTHTHTKTEQKQK
jgi:hypothetical protein